MTSVDAAWPPASLGDALLALGRHCRWTLHSTGCVGDLEPERAAAQLGIEAEPVSAPYPEVERMLCGLEPGVVRLPSGQWLALVGHRSNHVRALRPDLRVQPIEARALRRLLARDLEAPVRDELERMSRDAELAHVPRERTRQALLDVRLGTRHVGDCWQLRPLPTASLLTHLREARALGAIAAFLATHAARHAALLIGWWLLARAALEGRFDAGWLAAWVLVSVTQIPFALASSHCRGLASIRAGAVLKRLLLAGATRQRAEELRSKGTGELLGRVLEAEAVEALALDGGFVALASLIELLVAAATLASGAGGGWHAAALGAWCAAAAGMAYGYHRRRADWTRARLGLTLDLIQRMVGHRTRLVQEPAACWHEREDSALEDYLAPSRRMDDAAAHLLILVPRGWMLLGFAALAPALLQSAATAELALSLGGLLLAFRALRQLVLGVAALAGAHIAYERVAPLLRAEDTDGERPASQTTAGAPPALLRPLEAGAPDSLLPSVEPRASESVLLEAHGLEFRHRDRAGSVLRACDLNVAPRDRILLLGRSGDGKSTFGSLLTGLRAPDSGVLLLHGLDRHTLGRDNWRRSVASAPQFHENHVLSASFAFNLLMGKSWPPERRDLELAEKVCKELDLGPLLARMPAGIWQMVGETGWQLSHGERSRLFIARALLCDSELLVLDESFAALDPETLRRTFACVCARSRALLVIAHP